MPPLERAEMPTSSQRTLRVGATIVVAVTLAMLGTFFIGREERFWETKQAYEVRFTRINGLRVGAPVSLTGVDIGSVQGVSFPDDPGATYIVVSGFRGLFPPYGPETADPVPSPAVPEPTPVTTP